MSHPYAKAAFAEVFHEAATPHWVAPWGAPVLARPIPGSAARDALGVYPLAPFAPEADLSGGLQTLRAAGLVSIGLVPDPLAGPAPEALSAAFDLCAPYKTHQVVDFARPLTVSKHHRYEIRRAHRLVEVVERPLAEALDAWTGLYAGLVERREVQGLAALSPAAFARLAKVEGLVTLAAVSEGEIVAMHIWAVDPASGRGDSLFAASSAEGYRRGAAYALYDAAMARFAHLQTLNLGAGAGVSAESDGLARFKRGFANREVQALFCAAILDRDAYAALSGGERAARTPFPAYRFAALAVEA